MSQPKFLLWLGKITHIGQDRSLPDICPPPHELAALKINLDFWPSWLMVHHLVLLHVAFIAPSLVVPLVFLASFLKAPTGFSNIILKECLQILS